MFKIPENHEMDFVHIYFPSYLFNDYKVEKNWVFIEGDEAYCAIYLSNGLELSKIPPIKDREIRSYGRDIKCVVKLINKNEIDSFCSFIKLINNTHLELKEEEFSFDNLKIVYKEGLFVDNILQDKISSTKLDVQIGKL